MGWQDGPPPAGVDLAWLRIEEPDGDGGCDIRARLAGFDGEWWCECEDVRGEYLGEYINGNVIGWQPPLIPDP